MLKKRLQLASMCPSSFPILASHLLHSWLSCLLELDFVFVHSSISHCSFHFASGSSIHVFSPQSWFVSLPVHASVSAWFHLCRVHHLFSFLIRGSSPGAEKRRILASGATLQNLSIYQLCVCTSTTSLNQCINIDNTAIYDLQNV